MAPVAAYAALAPRTAVVPHTIERRDPRDDDVQIAVEYCGICHSDLHQVKAEWGDSGIFPMVPGHEIVGTVTAVGSKVTKFTVGDKAAVGCMVDACESCPQCKVGEEQYCSGSGFVGTYNGRAKTGEPTYGGYSASIVVKEAFVLRVPANLDLAGTAPLLCAGITTFSPLRYWGAGPGKKVGVVGIGGLGHMAVKLAAALGAEVTVFTTSPKKREEAHRLGAKKVVLSTSPEEIKAAQGQYDLIIDTVAAKHDLNLGLLKHDGTIVLVGVPEKSLDLYPASLIFGRKRIAGSLIGGIKETQEMLDFCGKHNITSDIELISAQQINDAYVRMEKGDVRYRFVIDVKNTIKA